MRVWLAISAVLLIGAGILVVFGNRTFTSWLVLVGAFANFMTFLLPWKARSRAG